MAVEERTGTRTAALEAERERWVARGVATQPVFVDRAHGARIVDVDGREYVDFVGGIGTLNGGHTPEAVVRAIHEQADRYLHQCYSVVQYEPYLEVCRRLCRIHPGDGPFKAMLVNSGAEAVENAVKIARHATGRQAVICFEQGFHGRTTLALTLTAKAMPYKRGFGPFAPEVYRAPGPWPYRGIGTREAIDGVRRLLRSQVDPSAVAAVIYEPVQGEGGFLPAPPGFIEELYGLCQEHGILYIDDEVQAGMCRTGPPAALDHVGISPDLAVWGKSLGGGLPLAAVTGRAEVMDAVHPGGLGGTFAGNPLSCVAAIVALDEVLDPAFQARATALGIRLRARLDDLATRVEAIGEVRGLGPMLALELVTDRVSKEPAAALTADVVRRAREAGLLLMAAGLYSNVLRVLVPLVARDEDVDEGLEILERCLVEATAAAA
ncbi:MAG: Gamma-aminobutyrate:alpha-ketoglutarate aminotransferase [uncultured Thermoleophilia bacterium]|uniref:(S)-3-amino-2-methylpropionate transaminase n=1 Tax=uncultured Thermoleophilia bacterium TaxID=1497501 RepID=A0A6J4TFG3_9ACTN|nr:MAG: Gamma-aminobutyrate:alpha-ketoglutarate aminotransferase [uncultured Thermoleophilia bacterium]